jgi:glycosyltransferase involved in cell wall biosynthesis
MLVLYAGRLSQEKNLPLLLRSFIDIVREHPATHLVVSGDGPLRRHLREKFAHPKIVFMGIQPRNELAALYASADIFALASKTETLSLVSLEAMSSGLPVLGMSAGGIRDIVTHRETGLLANSDQEFAGFLRLLVADASLRVTLGKNARLYAEGKTWDENLKTLERSYFELVSHGAR